jgi:ankyrin repeat protein
MKVCVAVFIVSMMAWPVYSSEDPSQKEFHAAITRGDLAAVQKLVEQQPDRVNTVFTIGEGKSYTISALCLALQEKQKAIAEYLLSKGADPKQGPQGFPPLYYASYAGYTDLIPGLIERGSNPNPDPEMTEYSPLICAQNIETAKVLIACGADVKYRNKGGSTPLHIINPYMGIEFAELMVQNGAEVNAKNNAGRTPLHEAAKERRFKVVSFLVDHGAEVNACDNWNRTPLDLCVQGRQLIDNAFTQSEYYKVLNLLISKGAGYSAEHLVRAGDVERLKKLFVEQPEQKNSTDQQGKSLLLCAIEERQAGVVEFLLQQGADANAAGKYSPPPLHTAVYAGDPNVVRMLLKAGADIHGKGKEEESALHWVAIRPKRETEKQEPFDQIAKILIDAGSEINGQAKKGRPDLHFGMEQPVDEIGEFFRMNRTSQTPMQIMAPRWLAYNAGDTPLHSAGRWGRVAIVRMLLDAGATVDLANDYGQTALHYAVAAGHTEIVKILLEAGADPQAVMKDGMSASQLAEKMNRPEALELLKSRRPILKKDKTQKAA